MPLNVLTRKAIWSQAWPIMVSQATIPLVGLVDTAVIGRTGGGSQLAAVALGVAIINLVFWTFGFLRMGVTGLTSQSYGAGDEADVKALLLRSVGLGLGLGLALFLLQWPAANIALAMMSGSEQAETEAGAYIAARFWGAPAALGVYALNGWLLGLGKTKQALHLQMFMNVANIAFDLLFVLGFKMGVSGVGFGTAAAEWLAFIFGCVLCWRIARQTFGWTPEDYALRALINPVKLKRMFAVNANIMVRTIALLTLFIWFTNSGARQGDTMLAANHILLQILSISAFVLDAFAFTAEARVGQAVGSGDRPAFQRAIRLTGEFALISGVLLAIASITGGMFFISALTDKEDVREIALTFLPFAAAAPLIGVASWMLDGIFIGATRTQDMRTASILATCAYFLLDLSLRDYGNWGVWIAFCASYVFRAGALMLFYPGLIASLKQSDQLHSSQVSADRLAD